MADDTSLALILAGMQDGQRLRFRLREGGNVVGAHPASEICLEVSGVSQRHAIVRRTAGQLTLEDLASKNGTFVNGERLFEGRRIQIGDQLTFGPFSLVVEETSAEDDELAVAFECSASGRADSRLQETPSHYVPSHYAHSPGAPSPRRLLGLIETFVDRAGAGPVSKAGPALEVVRVGLDASGICFVEGKDSAEPSILAMAGVLRQLPIADLAPRLRVEERSILRLPQGGALDEPPEILVAERWSGGCTALVVWDTVDSAATRSLLRTLLRLMILLWTPERGPAETAASPEETLVFPESYLPGKSLAMTSLHAQMRSIARSDLSVLILGATGTGKEGIAQTLHLSSQRAGRPFLAINCAAIPEELLEAELFGIGAGVATGVGARQGKFLAAQGGTIFLDEIGDMPPALQAKLLRVLQEREVQPLGRRPETLDVRIIAATHGDLEAWMDAGRFRRDLYYRLAGFVLHLPPLRERPEDIPELVAQFLAIAAREAAKDVRGLTMAAMQRLIEQPWPGNVRQLQNEVQRLVYLCPNHQVIDVEMLAAAARAASGGMPAGALASPVEATLEDGDPRGGVNFDPTILPSLDLESFEKKLVREALRRSGNNITRAAEALGLSRQALRRRLRRHGLLEDLR